MKRIVFFGFVVLVASILAFVVFREPTTAPAEESSTEAEDEVTAAATHPVSLQALMEKEFDGRDFVVGEVLANEDVYTRYAISYLSGDLKISGIMNVPKGEGAFPLLLLNHGYIDPDIYTTGRGLKREQDYLARRGFVVVHSDYRNHAFSDDDADYEASLRLGYTGDVINAVYALQKAKLPYINMNAVGMMGHSMGGGISQNVAVVAPGLVDAFVLYAPVSGDAWEHFERYTANDPTRTERKEALLALYGTPEERPEFWKNVSAKNFYEKITSPILVHIGTNDESTPPEWSYAINDDLEHLNKEVTMYIYENETHEFGLQWTLMMQRTAAFFDRHLMASNNL